MAGPLKTFFITLFKILLPFKNKNYFTLNHLSKYRHITLKFYIKVLYLGCYNIFQKRAIKIMGRKKTVKICFRLFMYKKSSKAIKPEGGGAIRRRTFFVQLD